MKSRCKQLNSKLYQLQLSNHELFWVNRNFPILVAPLTNLLKKDVFHWSTKSQQALAFDLLKTTITHVSVLTLPNFAKPFVLETDAQGIGIGVVLSQDNHPIALQKKTKIIDRANPSKTPKISR